MKLVFSDLVDATKAQELMDGYYAVPGFSLFMLFLQRLNLRQGV